MRLPTDQARIIVIGGGIVGVSTLYHLVQAGERDALLLERRELAAGATWHAAGNVHTQSAFANLSALQAYSLRLYDGLAEEVGQDVGSHIVGGFFLARTKERMEEFRHLAGRFRSLGLEYALATPDEIAERCPLLDVGGLAGGAWDPEEGHVDPHSVVMGLAAAARNRGARIRTNARVEAIRRLPSGNWLLTAGDETFECEIVVNCAGFWAREVAGMVGASLPVVNMEHQYLVTDTMPELADLDRELPVLRDVDSGCYMRQEGRGLLLGAWETGCREAWDGRAAPWSFGQELFGNDLDRIGEGIASACRLIPALETAGIRRVVNGAITFSPDGRPMIGPMPGAPGFFVACGFLGGIAQGGGIGLAMSQWILEGEPERDLHFIDVARFGDWTTREFERERVREIFPLRYEIVYPQMERKTGRGLRISPIHADLLEKGAVMGQAFGWERPLWFAQPGVEPVDRPSFRRPNWWERVGREVRAMSGACALSEMSSYGKFRVAGSDALSFLDHVGSARAPEQPGRMALTLLLNRRGGIVGDMTIANEGGGSFYLVGATLGAAIHFRWLGANAGGFDVRIRDVSGDIAALGVAGPNSRALLNAVSGDAFDDFPFMRARRIDVGGVACLALRVSYSGELGWELHCPAADQKALFDALVAEGGNHGLAFMGSRAMGMLRLEKGYRSWGVELTTEVTPHAAGLERFCSSGKSYVGSDAVDKERSFPPARRLGTLSIDSSAPPCWGTEPVLRDGRLVGHVTSGGMGWRTDRMLAVAWAESAALEPGTVLEVEILQNSYAAVALADSVHDPANARLLS